MRRFMCADACRATCCDSEPALTFPLLFASGFMSIFSVVIAFFKDIPDVKGDKRSAIQTLPVRLGVSACARIGAPTACGFGMHAFSRRAAPQERTVLNICVLLLLVAYTGCACSVDVSWHSVFGTAS
jgi:4-hydroxybenzoate polyprenyltransferase